MNFQSVVIFLSFFVFKSTAQAPSLLDALQKAGASKFAAGIESDPALAALVQSGQVQTVFAVPDDVAESHVKRQESPAAEQQLSLQMSTKLSSISALGTPPGVVVPTSDKTATLGGEPQKVVTDTRNTTRTSSTK